MTTAAIDEKKAKANAVAARSADMDRREKELNSGKSGKGLRTQLAMTRGKGTQEVQYEAFDANDSATLPSSLSEFMDLTKVSDEKQIVGFLVSGYNDYQYSVASDPIAEYVDASWDADVQTRFKLVVKNFAKDNELTIEDAVGIIKPAYLKSQAK